MRLLLPSIVAALAASFTPVGASAEPIYGAVLPTTRNVTMGTTATAFATILNDGTTTATGCTIQPATNVAANFSFQTTNPATNALTGSPNAPVNIPAKSAQTFLISLQPTSPFTPTSVSFTFDCANTQPAAVFAGVNQLAVGASAAPVADLMALAATPTNDGVMTVNGTRNTAMFAVGSANVGAAGQVIAVASTGNANLPLTLRVCETDTATGSCRSDPDTQATATVLAGTTPSFGVFVQSNGSVPFNPGTARIVVRFVDAGGAPLGGTSVAVRTTGAESANQIPVANAGPDQTGTVGVAVNLNGSQSFDPDGGPVAPIWVLSRPAGSNAQLTSTTSMTPSFTPDVPGTYVAQLIVADTGGSASFPDTVRVNVGGSLGLSSSLETRTLTVGSSFVLRTQVTYAAAGSAASRTINLTQTVTPSTGIFVSPPITSSFTANADRTEIINQSVGLTQPGTYQIVTRATIQQTGETLQVVGQVLAVNPTNQLSIVGPASSPGFITRNTKKDIRFTARVLGLQPGAPAPTVQLTGGPITSPVALNDTGTNGDLVAGDGVFSALVNIDANGVAAGTCYAMTARITSVNPQVVSPTYSFCTSTFDELKPSNVASGNLLTQTLPSVGGAAGPASTTRSIVANEISLIVIPGTTDARIQQLAALVGAQVVGALPNLNLYQLRLNIAATSVAQLEALVAQLQGQANVAGASVVSRISTSQLAFPADPEQSGSAANRWHLDRVRATEAWAIARGSSSVIVAVVDTGVDASHPDLNDKLVPGYDFVTDTSPSTLDPHGHGTSVASVAAAETNNNIGIAGVSWAARIMPMRVFDANGGTDDLRIARAIATAAWDGARIINVSIQNGNSFYLCPATLAAQLLNSIVVASAGNFGFTAPNYPGACPGVVSVGATDQNDARSVWSATQSSNSGSWVQVAAPGTSLRVAQTGGGYTFQNGTSFSSPLVAGIVANMAARWQGYSNASLISMLYSTARRQPVGVFARGVVDFFDAVTNGSFEAGTDGWTASVNAQSVTALGPYTPRDRARMGLVSTGPAGDQLNGSLQLDFTIQQGVTQLPIAFHWNFISEEFPEFCNTSFDDRFRVTLQNGGQTQTVFQTSVNTLCGTPGALSNVAGLSFPGGDNTVQATGWRQFSGTFNVQPGPASLRFFLEDQGDGVYDTEVLIDGLTFTTTPGQRPATEDLELLAAAR